MPRKELHSKLKFNRRGIVSLASPNTLVLTLAEVPALDSEQTVVGCVRGASIYNLVKIGELSHSGGRFTAEPQPVVTSATVTETPFDDLL